VVEKNEIKTIFFFVCSVLVFNIHECLFKSLCEEEIENSLSLIFKKRRNFDLFTVVLLGCMLYRLTGVKWVRTETKIYVWSMEDLWGHFNFWIPYVENVNSRSWWRWTREFEKLICLHRSSALKGYPYIFVCICMVIYKINCFIFL
jgi:hypothetical protein